MRFTRRCKWAFLAVCESQGQRQINTHTLPKGESVWVLLRSAQAGGPGGTEERT